jgi:tRNA modification GTPase
MTTDTIAAISTAAGRGGIGVIRISGPLALGLVPHFFGTTPKGPSPDLILNSHTMVHGYVFELKSNRVIDEVFLVAMRSPRSYTAEDVVEIQAHAGSLVMSTILNQVISAGARIAQPGEFTKRAFLNGRIDLTQAEAVADIIDARTTGALKIAAAQGTGELKDSIKASRKELIELLALLEAAIDFPDELEELIPQNLGLERVRRVKTACRRYIKTYEEAHFLRDGVKLAICGPPNVGKSSLMNRFLEKERSIVTEYPGTTRDLIEEPLNINGITFLVSDTAGMHQTDDLVEKIGIERAKKHIAASDLVLFMKDATRKISESELTAIFPKDDVRNKKIILVINKIDLVEGKKKVEKNEPAGGDNENLPPGLATLPQVRISALENLGIDHLRKAITSLSMENLGESCSVVPNLRHRKALEQAMESLETAETGFLNLQDEETLAIDIRLAADLLGEITGDTADIDILDTIFSKFCLGK